MMVWKMFLLFQGFILRFHVNLARCISNYIWIRNQTIKKLKPLRHTVFSTHLTIETTMALEVRTQESHASKFNCNDWSVTWNLYLSNPNILLLKYPIYHLFIELFIYIYIYLYLFHFYAGDYCRLMYHPMYLYMHAYNLSIYLIWILSVYPQDLCITNQQHAA